MKTTEHLCPGCRAKYHIAADPEHQPLRCALCNYPIRMGHTAAYRPHTVDYAEREGM